MIKGVYCGDDPRTAPPVRALALLSHGSQVTATSTLPATKAAPASPDFMFFSVTSFRVRPLTLSTWARNHSETEPWLTATVFPLRSATVLNVFAARMPSPPTEASMGNTSTAPTPFDCWRTTASTLYAPPPAAPPA